MATHLLMDNYTSELLSSLYQLQQCCHLCDLELKAKSGSVHIHAAVMAAACPQFLARVNKPHRGLRRLPRPPDHVDLVNYPVEAVQVFAKFLYTGEVGVIAVESVRSEHGDSDCLLQVRDIFKEMGLERAEKLVEDLLGRNSSSAKQGESKPNSRPKKPKYRKKSITKRKSCNITNENLIKDPTESVVKEKEDSPRSKLSKIHGVEHDEDETETIAGDIHDSESPLQSSITSNCEGNMSTVQDVDHRIGGATIDKNIDLPNTTSDCKIKMDLLEHVESISSIIGNFSEQSTEEGTIHILESLCVGESANQNNNPDNIDESNCISSVKQKETTAEDSPGNHGNKFSKSESSLLTLPLPLATRKSTVSKKNSDAGCVKMCENCSKEFSSKRALSKHIINCAAIKPRLLLAKCRKCKTEVKDRDALKLHEPECKGRPRRCRKCYKTFEDQKSLDDHRKDHERDYGKWYRENKRPVTPKTFQCDLCEKTFRTRMNKLVHMNSKHDVPFEASDVPVFSCDYAGCKYKNTSQALLDFHRQRHDGTRPYQCAECGKGFTLAKELKMHKRKVHLQGTAEDEMSTCNVCKKMMKSSSLKGHIARLHDPNNKLRCEFCDFQVVKADKSTLFLHLHTQHQQPMPSKYTVYTCPECPYMTVNKTNLNAHIRRHTGDFPYMCGFCGKRFPASSDCTSHEKFHIKDKKFKCPYEECSYAAVNRTSLKTHVKCMHTHKNSKDWVCSICDYRTNLKGNLHLHLRNVHKLEIKTNRGPTKINVAPGSRRSSSTPGVVTLLGGQVVATKGNPPQKLIVNILKTEGQLGGAVKLDSRVLPPVGDAVGTISSSSGLDLVQSASTSVQLMPDIDLEGHVLSMDQHHPGQQPESLTEVKDTVTSDLGIGSVSAAVDMDLTPAPSTISPGPESDYSSILLNPAETQAHSSVQNILDGQPGDNLEGEGQGQIYHQMQAASQSYNYQLPYDIPDVGQLGLSGLPSYFSNT